MGKPWNPQQQKFCDVYLANGYKATDAYRVAYPGVKESTVRTNAYALLKKPYVQEYIQERRKAIYDSLAIDAEHIAEELASIAFAEKGDETYTTQFKLKALDLLQKQLGLQNQKVNIDADVNAGVTIVEDYGNPEDNQTIRDYR